MNQFKTLVLLATLTALLLWAGQLIGGETGLVLALGMAGAMNLAAWWWSDRMAPAMPGRWGGRR